MIGNLFIALGWFTTQIWAANIYPSNTFNAWWRLLLNRV